MNLRRAIERFDIEAYLLRYAPDSESNTEWVIECPVCQKRKLVVNLFKRAWHCWYCQDHSASGRGGLLALIQLLENKDKSEAIRSVLSGSHDYVPIGGIEEQKILAEVARDVIAIPPPANWRYGSVDHTGILPYALSRGITYQDIVDFGLLWCEGGRYHRRLIFPVWEGGSLVYWQARAMWTEAEQRQGRYIKALNPPKQVGAAGATDVLMNLDVARSFSRVAVTEGPIDCIHVGRDAVCTFGKKISPVQIEKLKQAGVQALDLMWDGPSDTEPRGAWPEMFRFGADLGVLFDVRLVFLPKGDPGDYTREQLAAIRRDCGRPLSAYSALQEV